MMADYKLYMRLSLLVVALMLLFGACGATTYIVSGGEMGPVSIQDAINGAKSGDRVVVKSGVYKESVNVTKKLVLVGVDSGNGYPVVDSGNKRSAITLYADGIRLEGFVARNSGGSMKDAGIKVLSNDNFIRENTVVNNSYGIYMEGVHGNAVLENLANRNDVGISLSASRDNLLEGNTARNNSFGGFFIGDSTNNTLVGNLARRCAWVGIFLSNSTNNTLAENDAVSNANEGIWLLNSKHNLLVGNNVSETQVSGIRLGNSHWNHLEGCWLFGNLDGLYLQSSDNNTIVGNNFTYNHFGIYVDGARDNCIQLNDFQENVDNVYSWNSTNVWNSTKVAYLYNGLKLGGCLGNFWSDYSGYDGLGLGIGDVPYTVEPMMDHYPLMEPFGRYVVFTRALAVG